MDPNIRATKTYEKRMSILNGKDEMNEEMVYLLAKDKGYTFEGIENIGTLSGDELDNIAVEPPKVGYKEWKYYRELKYEELSQKFPEIEIFINKPTYEDYFYYSTRGYIPNYPHINKYFERWNEYKELSDISKTFLNFLYGGQKGYAKGKGHPLEKYIIAFDKHMDSESTIRAIAERTGFYIEENKPAREEFINKLYKHLKNVEIYGSEEVQRSGNVPTTRNILQMDEEEYIKKIKNYNPSKYTYIEPIFEDEYNVIPNRSRRYYRNLYTSRMENYDYLYNK